MTDPIETPDHPNLPSMTTRKNFVIVTLLATWSIIVFVLLKGEPTNSLHSSALAWAFMTNAAVLGAFIFGVSWDNSIFTGAKKS